MKNQRWKCFGVGTGILLCTMFCIGILFVGLFYNGIILFNNPSKEEYPVSGVDVSAYQGEIDWEILANQEIQFAFIKATEGSGFTDKNFAKNYEAAIKTDLRVGAYHFFSFDSAGSTQAENFIQSVYAYEDMLPPVVDVEFYGEYLSSAPEHVDSIKAELHVLLNKLETYYGKKPIIYATEESYELLIQDDFAVYDIWIRNVLSSPELADDKEWTFWQYTNRGRLEGYDGEEQFIDINVFYGTAEEFEKYGK